MKMRKLIDSFNYAIEGLVYTFRTQRNMKIHFMIALLTLGAAIVTKVTKEEAILLLITITLVIAAEMINTSIESLVDLVCSTYHPLAAVAKNVAAGAVFITAINAVIVGYIVFYDKISEILDFAIQEVTVIPVHATAISLVMVLLIVIIAKSFASRGTFLRGGMPSGHSALAASLFTSITLLSASALISGLAGLMTLIVLHSRVEARVHTLFEIVMGSLLGVLITIMIFQLFRL